MSAERDFILRGPVEEAVPVTETIGQHYLHRLQQQGDNVLLVTEMNGKELTLTSAQVLRSAKICSGVLRAHRLQQTDTVMVSCGNTLDFMPVMLGAYFTGVAVCPVSPTTDRADFQHLIDVMKPSLVFADDASIPVILEAVKQTSNKPAVMALTELARKYEDKTTSVADFRLVIVDDHENHVDLVMTSSGTTGRPKGVEYTGYSLLRMILNMNQMPEGTRAMSMSGPYWASGVIFQSFAASFGGLLVLLAQFSEKAYMDTLQKYEINFSALGPDQITALAKWPDTEKYDLPNLMFLACGGARPHAAMLELAEKRLGKTIVIGYGMTEAFMGLQIDPMMTEKPGNVGTIAKNCVAKVVDVDTGVPLGPNLEGELCFKSPVMLKCYRGNPEATQALFDSDGFLHSGDIGYYDEDGFFFIIDRIKELIKYKLNHRNLAIENLMTMRYKCRVPAIDIEEVLLQHDGVHEAAVVGIHNVVDTEHATAFVVKQPGSDVTAQELVALVQGKLPPLKWLYGGVWFLDAIPKTPSGKPMKRQLRANHVATLGVRQHKL